MQSAWRGSTEEAWGKIRFVMDFLGMIDYIYLHANTSSAFVLHNIIRTRADVIVSHHGVKRRVSKLTICGCEVEPSKQSRLLFLLSSIRVLNIRILSNF